VLDLFAGSGALGLEALSRGAASADFLENGRAALHALRANVARFRATDLTRVFERDAMAFLDGLSADAYDVAFADPPYSSTLAKRIVDRWREVPFARTLGVEHAVDRPMPDRRPSGSAGEGAFTVYRVRTGLAS
jgi:16S rRNA (guanine966-N2)-methyltransferase